MGMDIVPIKAKIELENNEKNIIQNHDLGSYIEKIDFLEAQKIRKTYTKSFKINTKIKKTIPSQYP